MYLIDEKLYKKKILDGDPELNVNKIFSNSILESYPRTAGMAGIVGATGQQGPIGMPGPQGVEGQAGPPGVSGTEGSVGPPGIEGPTGQQGPVGATGAQGVEGRAGPSGVSGAEGAAGQPGPPEQARTVAVDMSGPDGLVDPHQESASEEMDCARCQLPDDDVDDPDRRSSKRKINDEIEPSLQKQIKYTSAPNQEPVDDTSENDGFENEELLEMKEWLQKMRYDIDFPPRRYTPKDIPKSRALKRRMALTGKQANKTTTPASNENRMSHICLICHKRFKKRSTLIKHAQRTHFEYFEKERGGNKRKYETETSNASNLKKQKSNEKNEETEVKGMNIDPTAKKASSKKVMFICTYCLKKFQTKLLLKRHILIFHQTKKNIKMNLPKQIRTPRTERAKVSYVCSICETRFSREKSLSNHVRRSHKEYFEQWERDSKRKRTSEPEGVYVKRQKSEHKVPIHYQDYF